MTAGELCIRAVVIAHRSDTIVQAAQTMRGHHAGALVVVEEAGPSRRPIGIVTDRDLVVGVLAKAPEQLPNLRVGDLITGPLFTAREDELVHVVLRRMRADGVRRMPVVDERGYLVGVLALDDVVEFIAEEMADLAALLRRESQREQTLRA